MQKTEGNVKMILRMGTFSPANLQIFSHRVHYINSEAAEATDEMQLEVRAAEINGCKDLGCGALLCEMKLIHFYQ